MQNMEQTIETTLACACDLGKIGFRARQIGRGRLGAVMAFIMDHSAWTLKPFFLKKMDDREMWCGM